MDETQGVPAEIQEVKITPDEFIELASTFSTRAKLIRDFCLAYQPHVPQLRRPGVGMASLVKQFATDIVKVQTDFGGNFPQAISGSSVPSPDGATAPDGQEEEEPTPASGIPIPPDPED